MGYSYAGVVTQDHEAAEILPNPAENTTAVIIAVETPIAIRQQLIMLFKRLDFPYECYHLPRSR